MLQAQETGILSVEGARAVGEQGAGAGGGRRPDGTLWGLLTRLVPHGFPPLRAREVPGAWQESTVFGMFS